MSGVLYDADGNIILSPNAPAAPEQMVYDSYGNVINPALEDGNLLDIENVLASQLDAKLSTRSSETTLATINGKFIATAGGLKVDGSAVTQPVSVQGAVTLPTGAATEATLAALNTKVTAVNTGAVVVASSALPAGAALNSTLTDGTQRVRVSDAAGTALTSTAGALDVNIKSGTTVDVAVSETSDSILAYGFDGALNKKLKTNVSGQIESAVVSSALPVGAATEATVAAIDAKIPVDPATEGGNLALIKAKTDNLDATLSTRATEATLSALNTKIVVNANGLRVDGSAVTQPVSAAALPLPVGAATDAVLVGGNVKAKISDSTGNSLTSTSGALDINIKSGTTVDVSVDQASDSVLAYGFDGAVNQKLKTNASGQVETSVVSSVLPAGAATNAVLTGGAQKTQIVDAAGVAITASTINPGAESLNVHVDNWAYVDHYLNPTNDGVKVYGSDGLANLALKTDAAGELQVDVLTLPLPADAATQTTLAAINAKIPADPAREGGNLSAIAVSTTSIDAKVSDVATETTLAALDAKVITTANGIKTDGSAVTQPVSAAALPLPIGAATSAAQSDGTQKTQIVDGAGNVIGSTSNAVDVNIKSSAIQIQTSVSQAEDSILVYGNDGAANRAIKTDAAGQAEVVVTASALPTGAATEATVGSIDTKMPADPAREGGNLATIATASAHLNADLSTLATQATLSALNGKIVNTGVGTGILVDGSAVTQPVSAVALPLPSGAATAANQTTANTYLQNIDNSVATEVTLDAINDKLVNVGAGLVVSSGSNTFPISAVALPLPSGAAEDATLTDGSQITKIRDGAGNPLTSTTGALDVNVKSPLQIAVDLDEADDSVAVFGTDGVDTHQLRTNTLGELSVNVMASALPADAATETTLALQKAEAVSTNAKLEEVKTKLDTIATNTANINLNVDTLEVNTDQLESLITTSNIKLDSVINNTAHSAATSPAAVRLSDGTAFYKSTTPADTQPVSAVSLPLPTGAATSTGQNTGNASLASIDGKFAALGQHNMATSVSVAIASDQSRVPVIAADLPLPNGASTSTGQNTGNASLASIDTKTPALGQANMASSTPVTIALDQSAVPITSTQIGEVQVAPTANTVLDRLLQLKTQLTTQVRGLFDSAGNAISSALVWGERSLHVASLPYEAELTAEGKMFSVTTPDAFTAQAAGSGALYFNNTGTKTMVVWFIVCDVITAGRSARFEWWYNPTVTANGTLATPANSLAGSATASSLTAYTGPTITIGTGLKVMGSAVGIDTNSDRSDVRGSIQVPPGQKLGVVVKASQNGTGVSVAVKWAEVG